MNRIKVKRSKLLRSLVRGGADRRQMVRQLTKAGRVARAMLDVNVSYLDGAMDWSNSPQGHRYWVRVGALVGIPWCRS